MSAENHPVIRALRRSDVLARRYVDYLVAHGRPYQGVPLPDGVSRWKLGQCVEASEAMAQQHGWGRVQGWSIAPRSLVGDHPPVYHNWNTTDGETALDASVPDPTKFLYFGAPFQDSGTVDLMIVGKSKKTTRLIPYELSPGAFARNLERSIRLF